MKSSTHASPPIASVADHADSDKENMPVKKVVKEKKQKAMEVIVEQNLKEEAGDIQDVKHKDRNAEEVLEKASEDESDRPTSDQRLSGES